MDEAKATTVRKDPAGSLLPLAISVAQLFEANPKAIQPPGLSWQVAVLDWDTEVNDDGSVKLMITVGNPNSMKMPEVVIYDFEIGSEQWFDIDRLASSFKAHLSALL